MPLSVVILAAGQGKRMKSDLPKVLQPLAGRPLLSHVIASARTAGAVDIHVVYGHGGERVREALHDDALRWALQAEQHGTGPAVMQAMPGVADDSLRDFPALAITVEPAQGSGGSPTGPVVASGDCFKFW